jgi:hypothetical protein
MLKKGAHPGEARQFAAENRCSGWRTPHNLQPT